MTAVQTRTTGDQTRTTGEVLAGLAGEARLQSLEDSGLLSGGDAAMDRLARLASALLDAPRAFVSLVTPERQHLAGMVRHDDPADTSRDTPLTGSMCQFAVATEEPLVIPDTREDSLVQNTAQVRSGDIGAYAGVPLRTSAGHVLGTLCVVDGRARSWKPESLQLLEDLTTLAGQEVEQRLTRARERRLRVLTQQLAEQVPPLADAVRSLLDLADEQEEPRLQRYAALTRSRMEPVALLARRVESASAAAVPSSTPSRPHADLRTVAERCARSVRAATGTDAIHLETGDVPLPVRCDGTGLERSLTHAVVTALHHARGHGSVVLRLGRSTSADVGTVPSTGTRPTVVLTVLGEDSRVPTGELARIVSRFHEVICEGSVHDGAPATIRIAGGAVVAQSGTVRGEVGQDGRFAVHTRWPLDTDQADVS